MSIRKLFCIALTTGIAALLWRLNSFWDGQWGMMAGVVALSGCIYPYRDRVFSLLASCRIPVRGLSFLALLVLAYYFVLAKGFISGLYYLHSDTQAEMSISFLIFNSLQLFNEFPWWDPTYTKGFPLYYYMLSGWHSFLSPFTLPSYMLFKFFCFFGNPSINQYIAFDRTLYFFIINLAMVCLLSRELIGRGLAFWFPPLVFTFCHMHISNLEFFGTSQALPAALFYLFALIHHNNRMTRKSLAVFTVGTGIFLVSLNMGIVASAIYWSSCFTLLLVILNRDFIPHTWQLLRDLYSSPNGKSVIWLGATFLAVAVAASVSPVYLNASHVLRFRGEPIEYTDMGLTGSHAIGIETAELWTLLFCWIPFSDIHNTLPGFEFPYHYNDYRYVGMATLPLILSSLILGIRNRYILICLLTFFICNGFIIYSTDNLAYQVLIRNLDLIRNNRNMSSTFPRGGPPLFLIFAAGIGLKSLLQYGRDHLANRLDEEGNRERLFLAAVLSGTTLTGIGFMVYSFSHTEMIQNITRSLFHMGAYLTLFSLLCLCFLTGFAKKLRLALAISIFVFSLFDLSAAFSHALNISATDKNEVKNSGGVLRYLVAENKWVVLPDSIRFQPTNVGDTMWKGGRGLYFHNRHLSFGVKEWLILQTHGWGEAILKFDHPFEYPAFGFFTNAYFAPFDSIRKSSIFNKYLKYDPLFLLHDETLVRSKTNTPSKLHGEFDILKYTPNSLYLKTKTADEGFLYFADNHDRFWTASIDGQNTRIYRANYTFKTIELPAGTHEIRWQYNPYPVKILYSAFYFLLAAFVGVSARLGLATSNASTPKINNS